MAWHYNGSGWEEVYDNPSDNNRPKPPNNSASQTPPPTLDNVTNNESTESTNGSNKEFIEVEQNILIGDATVFPRPSRKAKATVLLQYLGKNLTGLYFVDNVTHVFSNTDGYSQTINVSRNGFGDTIKKGSANKPVGEIAPSEGGLMNNSGDTNRPQPQVPKVTTTTYTIKSGDTLWAISTKYLGSGSRYPEIFNMNRDIIKNPNLIYPGQKIKIPPR